MENKTQYPTLEYQISNRFWHGVFVGSTATVMLVLAIVMLATHPGPTAGEQLLTCTGDLGLTTAKLNALESRAMVIYESSQSDIPIFGYRNLVEVRPGARFTANRPLKPRWIVLPGETPIDLWKSESVAWAAYNLRTRQVEPPTIVRIEK